MTIPAIATRACASCGRPFDVPANNPRKRYCSPRCRVADWHHHHDRGRARPGTDPADAVHQPNAVADAVHPRNAATAAPNTPAATRCPHCGNPVTVINLLVAPAAAHVTPPRTPATADTHRPLTTLPLAAPPRPSVNERLT